MSNTCACLQHLRNKKEISAVHEEAVLSPSSTPENLEQSSMGTEFHHKNQNENLCRKLQ